MNWFDEEIDRRWAIEKENPDRDIDVHSKIVHDVMNEIYKTNPHPEADMIIYRSRHWGALLITTAVEIQRRVILRLVNSVSGGWHEMTLSAIRDALTRVPDGELRRAIALMLEAKRKRNTVFFIGNGGSAAIASHMAADFLKNGNMRAMCFNDSALVTCLANDEGYDQVFARPLDMLGEMDDVLVAISSSGRSKSIINAVTVARSSAMKVITLSGFTPENPLRQTGNVNFYVDSDRYGVVEVAHHAICHTILDTVICDAC